VALARGAPGGVFDEEQDVELAESDGVDDEGVTSDDPAGLPGEELGPGRSGASRGGIDAVTFQDHPDGGRCEAVAEPGEFAVDASVAPVGVLSSEADDELFSVTHGAGPARSPLRIDPSGRGQPTVPRQQRVGGDDESMTDPSGDHAGGPGDHATVDVGELGTVRGSLQDRDLVTERDDLGFEHSAWFAADDHQPDDGDEQPVDESAKSGAERGGRAGRHERARLRPANPQSPAGRADRVSGTYSLQVEGENRPVQVWYRHSYTADAVDVIAVTNR